MGRMSKYSTLFVVALLLSVSFSQAARPEPVDPRTNQVEVLIMCSIFLVNKKRVTLLHEYVYILISFIIYIYHLIVGVFLVIGRGGGGQF